MMSSNVLVCSIDIGKKNFALTIEKINTSTLTQIKDLPDKEKYNPDGTPTSKFKPILDKVYLSGEIVYSKNHDLTKNLASNDKYLDIEIYHNMTDLLDSLSTEFLDKCSYFVIEQQMSFGKKHNTMALKLGQHCQSYFLYKYGRFKTVVEFPSYNKTQVLGAKKIETITKTTNKIKYKPMDKPQRKKWSVIETKELLTLRKDDKTLSYLLSSKKSDDIADTIVQLQAWKYLHYIKSR